MFAGFFSFLLINLFRWFMSSKGNKKQFFNFSPEDKVMGTIICFYGLDICV